MAVVTQFKFKLEGFARRFINGHESLYSETFSLNGKPDTRFRVYIQNYHSIYLQCAKFDQDKELNLVLKFWLEARGNKFLERVQTCVFKQSSYYSDSFLTKSDLADLQKFIIGDSLSICLEVKLGNSISDFDDDKSERTEIDEHMSKLHSGGHFDLKIQTGGKEFKLKMF